MFSPPSNDSFQGDSDRLLVLAGPPAVHDADAAMEYAARLARLAEKHGANLLIVMQVRLMYNTNTNPMNRLVNTYDVNTRATCKHPRFLLENSEAGLAEKHGADLLIVMQVRLV